jgi:MFS family permease
MAALSKPEASLTAEAAETARPWYAEVMRYQWVVLAIASAGWMFDAFEGQLFNLTRSDLIPDLLGHDDKRWGDLCIAVFLIGGAIGGIGFGSLADRIGRKPTMALTILFYSLFSGLTYFATDLWQVAVLRFVIALGVGGEWAVGAALVAEVFPTKARARASSIFHATSVLGTWLAAIAGMLVGTNWRYAFLIGLAPALLVFWVNTKIHEPKTWQTAEQTGKRRGRLRDLFGERRWAKPAILGMLLATVGLGTFWSVVIAGQDLTKALLVRNGETEKNAAGPAKFAYGIVQTAGGGLGLLAFGPLAERWGRKRAFAVLHIGALVIVPITCYVPQTYGQMLAILPLYGFFTLGIHAGYAVYFPELFPNHLRATGTGTCFNGGRLLSALVLWLSAELKAPELKLDLRFTVTLLSSLFLVGLVLLVFLPETKGRPLPE